jgi:hypothetical protein
LFLHRNTIGVTPSDLNELAKPINTSFKQGKSGEIFRLLELSFDPKSLTANGFIFKLRFKFFIYLKYYFMNTKEVTIFIQTWLKDKGFYSGQINGSFDQTIIEAIDKTQKIPLIWSSKRKMVGMVQVICLEYDEDPGKIDGFSGPSTIYAYNNVVTFIATGKKPAVWRPEELAMRTPIRWPKQNSNEFTDFYGAKGSQLVYANCPYPMKIAWNPSQVVNKFLCHTKVKDSIETVLQEVLSHYGEEQIRKLRLNYFGGCFNDRAMRGGTLPSMHSWGIAIDFDPANNALRWGRDKATFAQPAYETWWNIWEKEGWISLGRLRNFDWMHVQAAVL